MAEVQLQEKSKSAIDGYRDVAINSVMKPAFLVLRLYLSTSRKANLQTLNDCIHHVKDFVIFLKEKKEKNDVDSIEMENLINLMETSIIDIEEKKSQAPVSLTIEAGVSRSNYENTIRQIQHRVELQPTDSLENQEIVEFSLVLCNLELQFVDQDLIDVSKEGNDSKLTQLKKIKLEFEKLKELCQIYVGKNCQ